MKQTFVVRDKGIYLRFETAQGSTRELLILKEAYPEICKTARSIEILLQDGLS